MIFSEMSPGCARRSGSLYSLASIALTESNPGPAPGLAQAPGDAMQPTMATAVVCIVALMGCVSVENVDVTRAEPVSARR